MTEQPYDQQSPPPTTADELPPRGGHADTASLEQALRGHLLDTNDEQRAHWVAQRRPTAPSDRTNWWLHLLLLVKDGVYERPQMRRRAWARLYLWAVDHATQTGVFTSDEAAIQVASFVAELRYREIAGDVADVLPPADSIVRDCLSQISIPIDAIPDATDLRLLDIETMRRSRQAKKLVSAAGWHQDQVEDPQVASQLAAWRAVLPQLV
ncbi:hypothetical protein [Krasilnikovia sp. MM14-A1259]|uniref:hypothetical protein n=1 Tax=Krasilnikovia sp. MM14-A1259 TaxID=3373539 RepID=UPI00381DA1AB